VRTLQPVTPGLSNFIPQITQDVYIFDEGAAGVVGLDLGRHRPGILRRGSDLKAHLTRCSQRLKGQRLGGVE
jgi:hypothetical protein